MGSERNGDMADDLTVCLDAEESRRTVDLIVSFGNQGSEYVCKLNELSSIERTLVYLLNLHGGCLNVGTSYYCFALLRLGKRRTSYGGGDGSAS